MTDTTTAADTTAPDTAAFDMERRATELAVLDALRSVVDPEIGMNVVELALIKQILLGKDDSEIKMILTTPVLPLRGLDGRAGAGAGRVGARAPRQGHPAGGALGPA